MSVRAGLRCMARPPQGRLLEVRKYANIFSTYSLCSVIPIEKVAIIASSIYTLSIAEVRVAPTIATSTYSLSTALT